MFLSVMAFYVSYAFGIVLGVCEFGQLLSNAFEGIDDEIQAFEWYFFSHDTQKFMPVIVLLAQQPVELECFGSIAIIRQSFKKARLIRY